MDVPEPMGVNLQADSTQVIKSLWANLQGPFKVPQPRRSWISTGSGKTSIILDVLSKVDHNLSLWAIDEVYSYRQVVDRFLPRETNPEADPRARFRAAAARLRASQTPSTARAFLSALADLIAYVLSFLTLLLILLMSSLMGQQRSNADLAVWKSEPIESLPQITPRGPNKRFPVYRHRVGANAVCWEAL